jgi:hypothetical protein
MGMGTLLCPVFFLSQEDIAIERRDNAGGWLVAICLE